MAGISTRTLQYYDEIGLLAAKRKANEYRYYTRSELLVLQQILLYKELGISLEDINTMVNHSSFNLARALKQQRFALKQRARHIKTLLKTVDITLEKVENRKTEVTDSDIFKGFMPAEI